MFAVIPDGAARARAAIGAALSCVVAGCLSAPRPAPPEEPDHPLQHSSENLDATAEQFLAALRAGDDAAASRDFAPELRSQLSRERLAQIRQAITFAHGPIVRWACTRRVSGTDGQRREYERREYEVTFERGLMAVLMSFDPATHRLQGLFFDEKTGYVPAPTPGATEFMTLIDATVGPGLGATVTVPRGTGGTPLPAVVFVPGTGPHDRDETVGPARPFRDLAEGLALRGIVSIRFDKRSLVHPELFKGLLFTVDEEYIQDALSAIAVLKRQPMVDGARVFVVGHSMGAWLAPEIATRAGVIAGVVMLAAPGRPFFDVLLDQVKRRGDADAIAIVEKERRLVADPTAPPEQIVEGVPLAFFRDLASRNAFELARRFPGPLLLLRGADDSNVFAVDQEAWIRNLAGRSDVTARTIPRLGHLLAPDLELQMAAGVARGTDAHVAREVIDEIATFITTRRAPAH